MDFQLINKYLGGNATEEEVKMIFEWIDVSPSNRSEYIKYKKVWALTSPANEKIEVIWHDEILEKINQKNQQRYFLKLSKYAAIFIMVFGLGALSYYYKTVKTTNQFSYAANTEIKVPLSQMATVVLPDGTTVQLNSGTTLQYSGDFTNGIRNVSLEGEAFFDVAKDKEHPFVVLTKNLDFKVYGTSFNVQAYSDDNELNTTLVEGSLGVISKSGKEYVRLKPGENINYRRNTNEIIISKANLNLYTLWKDGLITFRNETLFDISRKIERWYNVEIIIKDKKLADELYMGTIMRNKPVEQILEVLKFTSSLNYRIVPRADKPTLIYWE